MLFSYADFHSKLKNARSISSSEQYIIEDIFGGKCGGTCFLDQFKDELLIDKWDPVMIKQYKKKPVTIEAIQCTGSNFDEIKEFCGENLFCTKIHENFIDG